MGLHARVTCQLSLDLEIGIFVTFENGKRSLNLFSRKFLIHQKIEKVF